jgi:hypothetical protein
MQSNIIWKTQESKFLGSEKLAQKLINVIPAMSLVNERTMCENKYDFS